MTIYKIEDIKERVENHQNASVFVSGVTGQDGSFMVDYLLKNTPYNIYGGARRLSVANHRNIEHLENNPRFKLINFDLTDPHCIALIVSILKPAYFINLAAQTYVGSSWDFPAQTWECNTTGVLHILEAIRKYHPHCRFYNAGSSEEYGNVEYYPQDEAHPQRPRSPYGASKCAARQLVKVYRESYNLYAIQGLLYNHESPRRGEEFVTRKITSGISKIVNAIENKIKGVQCSIPNAIELGNLNVYRDWSFAGDFVDGIWRMLNQETYRENIFKDIKLEDYPKHLKEYILSSNSTHTIRDFLNESFNVFTDHINTVLQNVTSITNEKYEIKLVHRGEGLLEEFVYQLYNSNSDLSGIYPCVKINKQFYRPAEVELLWGCSDSARKEIGWTPKVTFKELVKLMVINDINISVYA